MTSYSGEYSCILFHNFRSVEENLKLRLRAPKKNIVLHSACSGASGRFWNYQCYCSEKLSHWVMTFKPFHILLMSVYKAWRCMGARTKSWPFDTQRIIPVNLVFGNSGRLLLAFLPARSLKSVASHMLPRLPLFLAFRISLALVFKHISVRGSPLAEYM